jgi:hypothetical protein
MHAANPAGGGTAHVVVHARIDLRHAQVAHHGEAGGGVAPNLLLQRRVEIHRIFVDIGGGAGHIEKRQERWISPARLDS